MSAIPRLFALFLVFLLASIAFTNLETLSKFFTSRSTSTVRTMSTSAASEVPAIPGNRTDWLKALNALPEVKPGDRIPAFFFAHGSPMLAMEGGRRGDPIMDWSGPGGPLGTFLKDFGPALLKKYKPKGIVVFSAHWETANERLVTDYGDENPLLMDYFGFPKQLYELKFKSRGDSALSQRVVELYKDAGLKARKSTKMESRGHDGRGFQGPGLDHGVFVPFRLMFSPDGPKVDGSDVPIVQVSIDSSLSPQKNWELGKAVAKLRDEGILVLSGGLTVHNLGDFASFSPSTAGAKAKAFDQALIDAILIPEEDARKVALINLTKHAGFRACHPREEHFVPLYVAAGLGEGGSVKILSGTYGTPTFAFGL